MTSEEREAAQLRELLHAQARSVPVVGDGLSRIQERIDRKRWWRRVLLPTAALVASAAAATAVLVAQDDPRRTDTLVPGTTPSQSGTPSPSAAEPGYDGPGLFPLVSREDASKVQSAGRAADYAAADAVAARLVDVLDLDGVTAVPCSDCTSVTLRADGRDVGTVQLAAYQINADRLFTVLRIEADDLTITSPTAYQRVASPLQVTGRVPGVDENVRLTVRSMPTGESLAEASAPAGSEAPWQATLSWTKAADPTAGLVAVTRSLKDGSVTRLAVVPVTLQAPIEQFSFAAIVDGHVSLFDSATGALIRQLTFPPAGSTDTEASWASGTVAWTRNRNAGACVSELDLRGPAGTRTVATSTTARLRSPQLSPSGEWLGWVEEPCDNSAGALVVSGGGAPDRRLPGPSGSIVELLDIWDNGALLVLTNDREATGPGAIGLVAPGARSLNGLTPLQAEPGCYLASGAAFVVGSPVAFQTCEDGIQLIRYSPTGAIETKDTALDEIAPLSVSAFVDMLLVWRSGRGQDAGIARYDGGKLTTVIANKGCTGGTSKGCVRDPDW